MEGEPREVIKIISCFTCKPISITHSRVFLGIMNLLEAWSWLSFLFILWILSSTCLVNNDHLLNEWVDKWMKASVRALPGLKCPMVYHYYIIKLQLFTMTVKGFPYWSWTCFLVPSIFFTNLFICVLTSSLSWETHEGKDNIIFQFKCKCSKSMLSSAELMYCLSQTQSIQLKFGQDSSV